MATTTNSSGSDKSDSLSSDLSYEGQEDMVYDSVRSKIELYLSVITESNLRFVRAKGSVVKPKKGAVDTQNLPKLESVSRIGSIPIVESGIEIGEKIYHKLRESNSLVKWSLSRAESSLQTSINLAKPAVNLLEGPITRIDKLVCMSLDIVEQRVPSIYLAPQTMISNTREYVLQRADSVKQIGTAVLDSRVTAMTAGALDRALTRADTYVDKFLPADPNAENNDVVDGNNSSVDNENESGRVVAAHTLEHGVRLRRKLQRRLTRQALAEAKAIKEQIHVLAYFAELIAKDPVKAWAKAREFYTSLSGPEPENQSRPDTLEELLVLLAREAARRVVHLINFTATDLPKNIRSGLATASTHFATAADLLLKTVHLDGVKETAVTELISWKARIEALIHELMVNSRTYLEQLAILISGGSAPSLRDATTPVGNAISRQARTIISGATINGVN